MTCTLASARRDSSHARRPGWPRCGRGSAPRRAPASSGLAARWSARVRRGWMFRPRSVRTRLLGRWCQLALRLRYWRPVRFSTRATPTGRRRRSRYSSLRRKTTTKRLPAAARQGRRFVEVGDRSRVDPEAAGIRPQNRIGRRHDAPAQACDPDAAGLAALAFVGRASVGGADPQVQVERSASPWRSRRQSAANRHRGNRWEARDRCR